MPEASSVWGLNRYASWRNFGNGKGCPMADECGCSVQGICAWHRAIGLANVRRLKAEWAARHGDLAHDARPWLREVTESAQPVRTQPMDGDPWHVDQPHGSCETQ